MPISKTSLLGLLAVLALPGCGVGQGTGEASTEDLIAAIALATTDYVLLDLTSGSVTTTTGLTDVETNTTYRDQVMVFRAIDEGLAIQGSGTGDFGHQADETPAAGSIPRYYIGVFEVTQAQWVRLAGSTPWSGITPAAMTATGDSRPAHGVSTSMATTVLPIASSRLGHDLSLPTEAQWERACRGGVSGSFAWGDIREESLVTRFALVAETAAGQTGPAPVGQRAANGYGLYDTHGNVWELTTSGALRGGSWRDSLAQARCANRVLLDQDTGHALVGLRLVLKP